MLGSVFLVGADDVLKSASMLPKTSLVTLSFALKLTIIYYINNNNKHPICPPPDGPAGRVLPGYRRCC